MRVSARADYALRAVLRLAQASDRLPADKIADDDIPPKFLESILAALRRAGLVDSRRGARGGHRLAKPADEISIADVIRAVDGPLVYIRDERPSDLEGKADTSQLVQLWVALRASVRRVLEDTTIEDLRGGVFPPHVAALLNDPRAWSNASPLGD